MTAREVYEATLAEANKINAPTFTIEEFNYYVNKALLAFSNERYNFYNINQQLSDDLRVLLKTAKYSFDGVTWNPTTAAVVSKEVDTVAGIYVSSVSDVTSGDVLSPVIDGSLPFTTSFDAADIATFPYLIYTGTNNNVSSGDRLYISTAQLTSSDFRSDLTTDRILDLNLPASDYFHSLSVRTYWSGEKLNGTTAYFTTPAKRLTYDMLNVIENNAYMKPKYNRPYFMVWDNEKNGGVQGYTAEDYKGNQNRPKFEIHVGPATSGITLKRVEIDYLKMPEKIVLDEVDIWASGTDGSQVLEFPDYLKNQIVRRITDYILEVNKDQRLPTHNQINQEIPAVPLELQRGQQQPNNENQ